MPVTKVNYKLILSKSGITISKISFNDKSKEGGELQQDYKSASNTFEGEFRSVVCDCQTINIVVVGDGPAGGNTKMSATLCRNKKLRGQPIKKTESNGSYSYTKTVQVVSEDD